MNFHGERKSDKLLKTGCPYGGARYRGLFIYIPVPIRIRFIHIAGYINFPYTEYPSRLL